MIISRSKADSNPKYYSKATQNPLQMKRRKTVFETVQRHWKLFSEPETDMVILICRDAIRYFFVAVIVLCLCAHQ
jgi:hypothetical protein